MRLTRRVLPDLLTWCSNGAVSVSLLSVALVVGGCGHGQQAPPPLPPPEVAVIPIEPQEVVLTTELPGRTAAYRVSEIRPQVSGLIQKRLFEEGADVKAGQILYQIDPEPFRTALDNANAALARAEANLPAIKARAERFKELVIEKAVSQQDYDDAAGAEKQAEAEVAFWKAQVETARINLGYCRVVAPISGRIGRSNVTEGAIVTAYQPVPLATIQQLDPMYVDVPQSTSELLRLQQRLAEGRLTRKGANQHAVELRLEDGTTYPLEGRLQFRDVSVEPSTGSVILRMVFPNPKGVLLPGMFVRALVREGVNEHAIVIPQQAVSRDPKGNPLAFVVDADGNAQPRMLGLDRAIGNTWLVASGLAAGDRLIVEGLQRVRPGVPVRAAPLTAQGKETAAPGMVPQPGSNAE
jgi:membrane fusion protein (multidrug efflux system)